MSLENLDRAIATRLLGLDVEDVFGGTVAGNSGRGTARMSAARGSRGSGFNSSAWDAENQTDVPIRVGDTLPALVSPSLRGALPTTIPIFRFNPRGRRAVEVWPSISYEIIGEQDNPQRWIHPNDRICTPIEVSRVEVTLRDGRRITGPTLVHQRPHPEPVDVMFEVRSWSRNNAESLRLHSLLKRLLPYRGALKMLQDDGTTILWDLLRQTINNTDFDEPTSANPEQREYSWVMTYVVETHLDNTVDRRTVPTVLATEVEIVPN